MSSLGHTWPLSELKPPCFDSAAKVLNLNPVTYWLAGEWRMIAYQSPLGLCLMEIEHHESKYGTIKSPHYVE